MAARKGNLEIIKVLLKSGANLNIASNDGMTPLIIASNTGNINVITLLLSAKADISIADKMNFTSLTHAASQGHNKACEILISSGAAIDGNINGPTPLLFAVMNQNESLARLLLKSGANPQAKVRLPNGTETSPLEVAKKYEYKNLQAIMER